MFTLTPTRKSAHKTHPRKYKTTQYPNLKPTIPPDPHNIITIPAKATDLPAPKSIKSNPNTSNYKPKSQYQPTQNLAYAYKTP